MDIEEAAEMKIRILSYNIQRAIHLDGLLRLFDEIPAFREADVIAIQEASFIEGGGNVLAALAGVLSSNHRWTYKTVMSYPNKEYGNGFLFRNDFEITNSYAVPLPQVTSLSWYEKQKTEGGSPDTKSAFVQYFLINGQVTRITNVHLDYCGGVAHRRAQLQHLLKEMTVRTTDDHPAVTMDIICGDFNTVGHYRLPVTQRNTRKVLDNVLSRNYVEVTSDLQYTQ